MVQKYLTLIIVLILSINTYSKSNIEVFALGTLVEGSALNEKFNATGSPVFLIKNMTRGVSQGDIIRFKDRVVLIDRNVWGFLRDNNLLGKIKLLEVKSTHAKISVSNWKRQASRSKSKTSKNAYKLGSKLLSIFSNKFGNNDEFVVQFRNGKMIVLADKKFLRKLRFKTIKTVTTEVGKPQIISLAPDSVEFQNTKIYWQAWAVAANALENDISYELKGDLPKGVKWDKSSHSFLGTIQEVGRWDLKLIARNPKGQTDELPFHILSRPNKPPKFSKLPADTIYKNEVYRYLAEFSDPDHSNELLKFEYRSDYPYIKHDSLENILIITPPSSQVDSQFKVSIKVTDPLGEVVLKTKLIQLASRSDKVKTTNIDSSIPFDTLVSKHHYTWDFTRTLDEMKLQGYELFHLTADDSLLRDGPIVTLYPTKPGKYHLKMGLKSSVDTLRFEKVFTVEANSRPVFYSSLDINDLTQGNNFKHRLVAKDFDNDPVTYQLLNSSDTSSIKLIGDRLFASNKAPGDYEVEVIAVDSTQESTPLLLTWSVKGATKNLTSYNYKFDMNDFTQIHSLYYETAWGRMGVLTNQIAKVINMNQEYMIYPYLFAGVNMFDQDSYLNGEYFFLNMGFTLRKPHEKLTTGGVFTSIDSRAVFENPNLVSDFEMSFIGNQLILMVDTNEILPTNVNENDFLEIVNNGSVPSGNKNLKLVKNFQRIGRLILDEYAQEDNLTFFTRWTTVYPLHQNLLIGPQLNLMYFPVTKDLIIVNGLLARVPWDSHQFNLEQNLSMSYAYSSGIILGYSVQVGFGVWK